MSAKGKAEKGAGALAAWVERFRGLLAVLAKPGQALRDLLPLPEGGEPDARLAVLNELWAALGTSGHGRLDAAWFGQSTRGTIGAAAHDVSGAAERLAVEVLEERQRLLAAGAEDPAMRFLVHDKIADGLLAIEGDGNRYLPLDTLPDGHWARTLLPEGETFALQMRPVLVLGPKATLYSAEDVVSRTKAYAAAARREAEQKARVQDALGREREAAFKALPENRLRDLEVEVQELKKALAEKQAPSGTK